MVGQIRYYKLWAVGSGIHIYSPFGRTWSWNGCKIQLRCAAMWSMSEETVPCIHVSPKLLTLGHCGKALGWISVANSAFEHVLEGGEKRLWFTLAWKRTAALTLGQRLCLVPCLSGRRAHRNHYTGGSSLEGRKVPKSLLSLWTMFALLKGRKARTKSWLIS